MVAREGVARGAAALVTLLGCAVLAGWALDIGFLKSLDPDWVAMKANTALAFLLTGIGLGLAASSLKSGRRAGSALGLLVAAIGALTLSEHLFPADLGIDQALFREPAGTVSTASPGRMAPATAFCFSLLGAALFLMDVRTRGGRSPSTFLVLASGFVGLLALAGYLYDISVLYHFRAYTSMAAHTAAGILAASVGILAARPDRGLAATAPLDPTRRYLLVGGGLAAAILAGMCLTAYRTSQSFLKNQEEVLRTHRITTNLHKLLSFAVDRETGFRGFLVSGSEEFLEPHSAAGRRIPPLLLELKNEILDPRQMERLSRLELILAERSAFFSGAIDLIRSGRSEEAADLVRSGQGKNLTDEIRAKLSEMEARETELLDQREAKLDASEKQALAIYLSSAVAIVLVLAVCAVLLLRNLASREAAEKALKESERVSRTLFEEAPDAILAVDLEGRIRRVNSQTERLFGYPRAELDGQPVERLVPEPLRAAHVGHRDRFVRDMSRRALVAGKLVGIRKDGSEVPVAISLGPFEAGEERMVLAVVRDVTDQRRAEKALEEANGELEAFSYSVSHDLRAPLRSIDGFSQALLEDCAAAIDETGRGHLARIRAAAQRMGLLIDDLLRLSRVTRAEIRKEEVDLTRIARRIARDLAERDPGRRVEFRIQEGLAARGDPGLLAAALENLMGNAWKFSAKTDAARIEVGRMEMGKDGTHAFFVRDNGAGFDMAYAGKLFGAFQRLHGSGEFAGTGIGLATVQRIVRRHGGRVWAEGEVGKGATFHFTIPG